VTAARASWAHRLSVALVFSTLALIFIGGLVTTTHSGLSVPDWPLSYGQLMPPMIGGILFEHGHRMAASGVGFLTVVLALVLTFTEKRRWVKTAGWAAVGLVILQGVLGGLTVLYKLPKPISIAHGCTAQTFFALTVALSVWTSPRWGAFGPFLAETGERVSLRHLSYLLTGSLFVQLVLGAVVRHTGLAVAAHVIGAGLVTSFIFWIFGRVFQWPGAPRGLFLLASGLLAGVLVQLALGLSTYFFLSGGMHAARAVEVVTVTAHVMTGAALLGLSVMLSLWAYSTGAKDRPLTKEKVADYFTLTKPGISLMTGLTALAGYILGARGEVDFERLIHTGVGTFLVSAGACTFNMLLEIDVDARMRRTEKRPLPAGRLKPGEALLFGALLSVGGIAYLCGWVNVLTGFLAGLTLSVYIYLYTPLKKISALCTTVGAVSGALPPVMGWAAARGSLGVEAWALFAILFFWQFPHFLALAWMYKDDYARAGLTMLPASPDGRKVARDIVLHSFALLGASLLPAFFGLTGAAYVVTALIGGAFIAFMGFRFSVDRSRPAARRLFLASVAYLPVLLLVMTISKPHP